uniref:Uncharacterized protein n=1 Tax=Plectus sambesii TaxID=2011161 RepID=A0A914W3P4_9BILA
MINRKRKSDRSNSLCLLLLAFGASYFVFMGSVHILFFYLKHQFGWDAGSYGYLKGTLQGAATLMALFIYPLLKKANVRDTTLALIGLFSRMLGRMYLAVVWNTASTFGLVFCDMFSRFGAAALRSLMSQEVDTFEQGKVFALVAILEGSTSLIASTIFNSLFPATLSFFPQLSYIILSMTMILPIVAVLVVHKRKKSHENQPIEVRLPEASQSLCTPEPVLQSIGDVQNEEEIY